MATSPNKNKQGAKAKVGSEVQTITGGINAIVESTKAAFAGADPSQKLLVLGSVIAAIVTVVLSGLFIAKDQYGYALTMGLAAILCLLLVAQMLYRFMRHQSSSVGIQRTSTASQQLALKWARPMLRMPWLDDDFGNLTPLIEAIQNRAFIFLSEKADTFELKPAQVRVNVFLPDYFDGAPGEVCSLVIHPKLSAGMSGCPDARLRLRISQGVTGKMFREQGGSMVARVLDAVPSQRDFNDIYELTPEQKAVIHQDLKWIVSTPLNIEFEKGTRTIGVLNVDGLVREFETETLKQLAGRVLPEAMSLAKKLSEFPLVIGVIGIKEVLHV